nr:hypothetical protein [uncultured Mucilaginibacter sp.]
MTDIEGPINTPQVHDVTIIDAKIYSVNQIRLATFLGGPLVAGYLAAINFRAFNEYYEARNGWMLAIAFSVIIFAAVFLLPETIHMPNWIIPLAYAWLTSILIARYQGRQIREHFKAGGQNYDWGRTIVIALIGAVITFGLIFVIAFMLDTLFPTEIY